MPRRILLHSHHRLHKVRFPWRTEGIARALAARGHEVTILCTAEADRLHLREAVDAGVRFVTAPDLLWGRQRSGWDAWSGLRRWAWLRRERFDLIHLFDTRPAVIHPTLAGLRHAPTPLVIDWADWWGRGGLITENRPRWYRFALERFETHYEEHFRRRADATTVIARGLGARAVGLGVASESIFWVPNGCTPARLPDVPPSTHRAEFQLPPDAVLVGFNAADVTIGFPLVLEAFATAAAERPDLRLVITGRLPPSAQALVAASPAAARISALGYLETDAYARLLTCVDAFLLPFVDRPANRGRWPGRINDYLSAARPVITNPVGEMATLLRREPVGLLCEESVAGFAAAIRRLAADPAERQALGRRARRLAETELHWTALGATLEQAYACAERRHAERRVASGR